jgi:oxygen-independent coproporphyrinogen III oxidase
MAKTTIFAERSVPRYTSYPTAPNFGGSIRANIYASWLDTLSKSDVLSLYVHVPFCQKICLYCGCHTKATLRSQPVEDYLERLITEIALLRDHTGRRQIARLHWGGGTPSILTGDGLRRLIEQLDACFDLAELSEHAFELDPRYVTKTLVSVLSEIGVTRVSLGVQDLSPHVQKAIGRIQPFSVVQRAVDSLRETGINEINIDLMYGLPSQSAQDVQLTATLVHQLKPQRLAVFGYAHVPWIKRHQRLLDQSLLPTPAARLGQSVTAHGVLTSFGYEPIGLDHYAEPGDSLAVASRARMLRRNFQGYTTDDAPALIGIGASAISRLPQGFVQNAADTASYSRAIWWGELAAVRGIALSVADRIRGRIIEELMCHLYCDIGALLDEYGAVNESFEQEFEALQPFVADGYVRIDGDRIFIYERGRPSLRLIAATFDEYLMESRTRHSMAV